MYWFIDFLGQKIFCQQSSRNFTFFCKKIHLVSKNDIDFLKISFKIFNYLGKGHWTVNHTCTLSIIITLSYSLAQKLIKL